MSQLKRWSEKLQKLCKLIFRQSINGIFDTLWVLRNFNGRYDQHVKHTHSWSRQTCFSWQTRLTRLSWFSLKERRGKQTHLNPQNNIQWNETCCMLFLFNYLYHSCQNIIVCNNLMEQNEKSNVNLLLTRFQLTENRHFFFPVVLWESGVFSPLFLMKCVTTNALVKHGWTDEKLSEMITEVCLLALPEVQVFPLWQQQCDQKKSTRKHS